MRHLFAQGAKNTIEAYTSLYQMETLPDFEDGNIGDIGFFLLALQKYQRLGPLSTLQQTTKKQLIDELLQRQRGDGSFKIFFNKSLERYEKESEAFYLPEALIGLCGLLDVDNRVENALKKALVYVCTEENRKRHMQSETATFYTNWQFQLLYHWIQIRKNGEHEKQHLLALISALKKAEIATTSFDTRVATVEVACFFEGLVHAQACLNTFGIIDTDRDWFDAQINRALSFLYEVQQKHLARIHGGFVHYLNAKEARIDVAGHVFSGLQRLLSSLA